MHTHTAAAIQYVKAAGIAVAFVAAVLILLERSPRDSVLPDSGVPCNKPHPRSCLQNTAREYPNLCYAHL